MKVIFFFSIIISVNLQSQNTILKEMVAQVVDIEDYEISTLPGDNYSVYIRDRLGDFETWENLYIQIGNASLKYNIDTEKQSTVLYFNTDEIGWYEYTIYGSFMHIDGDIYKVTGTGKIHVKNSFDIYDIYGRIDTKNKTANAFFLKL